jgi:transcriptional regulator with XRE-family HTH domain
MKTRAPRPEPLTTDEPVPGDPRSEFGKKLRAARIRAGLTHAEVAEQAGLTQQYVSVVEGGRQNITLSTMIALARVTGHEVRVVLRRVRRQPEVAMPKSGRAVFAKWKTPEGEIPDFQIRRPMQGTRIAPKHRTIPIDDRPG